MSQFAGYVLGLTLLTLGVFALTVYLSEVRGERWTLVAMVLSILGIGLLLSRYGLRTYAVPALGEAYLDGAQNAVELANAIFGDLTQSVFYAAFLLHSAGFILFGFAVWGSGTLPKWAGVLLALHAPLFSTPLPDLFSVRVGHCYCSSAVGGSPSPSCGGDPPEQKRWWSCRKECGQEGASVPEEGPV